VARQWWEEKMEKDRREQTGNRIDELREQAIRHQLMMDFPPLTTENAIQLVRYVPGKRFSIFDEKGAVIFVSTDAQKIYVERIDPGHPLANMNPVGFYVNRAALRNMEDAPGDNDLGRRAYELRCYLRNHPLIVEALKPLNNNAGENQQNVNVVELFPAEEGASGKDQVYEVSTAL